MGHSTATLKSEVLSIGFLLHDWLYQMGFFMSLKLSKINPELIDATFVELAYSQESLFGCVLTRSNSSNNFILINKDPLISY